MRLAADENFDGDIVRGLLRRRPGLDIVRVQDEGLSGALDDAVLDWAAHEGRLLLTHDASTIGQHAYGRVLAGKLMPGVVLVGQSVAIGVVIDDILLLVDCSTEGEWTGQVLRIPLSR